MTIRTSTSMNMRMNMRMNMTATTTVRWPLQIEWKECWKHLTIRSASRWTTLGLPTVLWRRKFSRKTTSNVSFIQPETFSEMSVYSPLKFAHSIDCCVDLQQLWWGSRDKGFLIAVLNLVQMQIEQSRKISAKHEITRSFSVDCECYSVIFVGIGTNFLIGSCTKYCINKILISPKVLTLFCLTGKTLSLQNLIIGKTLVEGISERLLPGACRRLRYPTITCNSWLLDLLGCTFISQSINQTLQFHIRHPKTRQKTAPCKCSYFRTSKIYSTYFPDVLRYHWY